MSEIAKRTVTRYFLNGKGYATLTTTARVLARLRLREIARQHLPPVEAPHYANDHDGPDYHPFRSKEDWHTAYAALFHNCGSRDCDYCYQGGYDFCIQARRCWIQAEANRIAQEFTAAPQPDAGGIENG